MKKRVVSIIAAWFILAAVIFGLWLGCINHWLGLSAIGCACPHPKFTLLRAITGGDECQNISGFLFK